MQTVTLSPKFQVVIPQAVRTALGLRAGEKFHVLQYDGRIEFIPVRTMKQSRGFLKGGRLKIDTALRDSTSR